MPYIKQEQRTLLDPLIDPLAEQVLELASHSTQDQTKDGAFNYCITRLALKLFGKKGYSQFVRVAGNLEEAKAEYRRRVVVPYEDDKLSENGDVY